MLSLLFAALCVLLAGGLITLVAYSAKDAYLLGKVSALLTILIALIPTFIAFFIGVNKEGAAIDHRDRIACAKKGGHLTYVDQHNKCLIGKLVDP